MAYNIIKVMMDPKTGTKTHVLLTDGLSEIWDIKKKEEALRITTMLNENSDSGHKYEIRGTCKRSK